MDPSARRWRDRDRQTKAETSLDLTPDDQSTKSEHDCLSEAVRRREEAIHVILGRVDTYVEITIP